MLSASRKKAPRNFSRGAEVFCGAGQTAPQTV
jgi:hypothetical protein